MRVTAERYLSLQEVGDELGVSDQTVRRWVKAGELAAYKPGKEYRIKDSDLEEFLQTREVSPKVQSALPESSEERRMVPLRSWIDFVGRLADRWEREIEEREQAMKASSPAVQKHVKQLPDLAWAVEIRGVAFDVIEATSTEPGRFFNGSDESHEFFVGLKKLEKLIARTDAWPTVRDASKDRTDNLYDFGARLERVRELSA